MREECLLRRRQFEAQRDARWQSGVRATWEKAMNRPHMLGCTGGCFVRSPAGLGSGSGASSTRSGITLPQEIAGVRVPDTALAKAVIELVRQVSPDGLFNHVVRSYVLGTKAG